CNLSGHLGGYASGSELAKAFFDHRDNAELLGPCFVLSCLALFLFSSYQSLSGQPRQSLSWDISGASLLFLEERQCTQKLSICLES
ncbi:unnamed protein product, partial [Brassica oleracea var. botrytis]